MGPSLSSLSPASFLIRRHANSCFTPPASNAYHPPACPHMHPTGPRTRASRHFLGWLPACQEHHRARQALILRQTHSDSSFEEERENVHSMSANREPRYVQQSTLLIPYKFWYQVKVVNRVVPLLSTEVSVCPRTIPERKTRNQTAAR